jgi:hypothetical protein
MGTDDGRRRIECGIGNAETRGTKDRGRMTDINKENAAFATPDIFK